MKRTVHGAGRFLLLALVIVGSPVGVAAAAGAGERTSTTGTAAKVAAIHVAVTGVAVVELFTSEACSSCPPADVVLTSLLARSRATGMPVVALAWHVGYWNGLGWKDPYSLPAATQRQRRYASTFSSSLYTPEIVVNGTQVAGSAGDLHEVSALTAAARRRPARSGVVLAVREEYASNRVVVRVATSNAPSGSSVGVALVENGLVDRPNAGENAGRTLTQNAVVRSFAVLPAAGGQALLTVPAGTRLDRSRVVAFVQTASLAIVGANEIGLDARKGARALVTGRLLDRTGSGIEGAQIQACSDALCIPAATDSSGRFTAKGIPPGNYDVKLFLPERSPSPIAALPLEVRPGEDVLLPTFDVQFDLHE